ncbi:LCP family protein [Streptomyces sp. NPDC051907]|uniref:LCP family protein n=1 Tax=Streptomyces sp. NPDC051907 TaxID=3155284 RepID=UPI0034405915
MDAHVTDSAGTPAEPDDDGPAAEPDDGGAAAGGGPDKTPPESGAETGSAAKAGSAAEAESRAKAESGAEAAAAAEPKSTAGTDAGTDSDPDADREDGPDADGAAADSPKRKRHWLRWTALGTAVVVLAAAGVGWWFYRKLDANITADTTAAAELETYEKERPTPVATDAQNILLLGSDTRSGEGNSKYGRDEGGSQRSDTTILLHIAADRQSATAMSIPRDLMVTIPSCRKTDGKRTREQFAQFNWAFQFGGTACTIRTVERFTGIRIDHHMVVDFRGFKDMVDAVHGVEVCLKKPIDDAAAHLKLPAGKQKLNGEQALGYVRARKTLGNGSDTERMDRQQQFLGALVKKVQSNGVLLNPTRLYPVLDAATKAITTDPGLASLKALYDLTRSLRNVPTEKVQFLTVPRQPYAANPNRDELVEPEAGELFKRLREDAPITVVPGDGKTDPQSKKEEKETEESPNDSDDKPGDSGPTSPGPTPTFPGTNAAKGMCE